MSEERQKTAEEQKRVLGDEWKSWDGGQSPAETEASLYLFVGISAISFFLCVLGGFFFWYLISPRVQMLSPAVTHVFKAILILGLIGTSAWFFLILLEIQLSMHFRFLKGTHIFYIKAFYFLGSKLSRIFHINKDVFDNSFVKVSNFLIGKSLKKKAKKTLVLLPRCLQKDVKEEIQSLSKRKNVPVFIVGGGEQARRIIGKEKPDSIIAVACERDLVAGIQDIPSKLAVIGIPNKRPNGPCLNTLIDIGQLEEALKLFTHT